MKIKRIAENNYVTEYNGDIHYQPRIMIFFSNGSFTILKKSCGCTINSKNNESRGRNSLSVRLLKKKWL